MNTQTTGAVYMMQRMFGNILLPPSPSLEVGNAAAKLKSLATYGGIVTDTMSDTMVQYLKNLAAD